VRTPKGRCLQKELLGVKVIGWYDGIISTRRIKGKSILVVFSGKKSEVIKTFSVGYYGTSATS